MISHDDSMEIDEFLSLSGRKSLFSSSTINFSDSITVWIFGFKNQEVVLDLLQCHACKDPSIAEKSGEHCYDTLVRESAGSAR